MILTSILWMIPGAILYPAIIGIFWCLLAVMKPNNPDNYFDWFLIISYIVLHIPSLPLCDFVGSNGTILQWLFHCLAGAILSFFIFLTRYLWPFKSQKVGS